MDLERARNYRRDLSQIIKITSNRDERRLLLESERQKPVYQEARQTVHSIFAASQPENATPPVSLQASAILNETSLGRPLTEEEQVSLWAYEKAKQYDQLPRNTSAERRRVSRLVQETSHELIAHPKKIITAGAVWKSQQQRREGQTESFYTVIQEASRQLVREDWQRLTTQQLGGLVRAHAYGDITKDLTAGMLEAFFKGPGSISQASDAFYTFTDAALDLVSDKQALEEAVRIGLFGSPVLVRGSKFWNLVNLARVALDDDKLLQRSYIADNAIGELCVLTTLDRTTVINDNYHFMATVTGYDANYLREQQRMALRTIKKFGLEGYTKRAEIYRGISTNLQPVTLPAGVSFGSEEWPLNLLHDSTHPLRKKFLLQAAPRVAGEYVRRAVVQLFQESEGQPPISFTLVLPEDRLVDIYVSGAFDLLQKQALIRRVVEDLRFAKEQQGVKTELAGNYRGTASLGFGGSFNGQKYLWSFRSISDSERLRHPLSALEEIGFPVPVFSEEANILTATHRVHQQLLNKQSRYLNRRGYKAPLVDSSFRDLGYKSMTFYQDTGNASRVDIEVDGLTYSFKLDRFFNLDFEGRLLDNPLLEQSLHYSALFLLSRILCDNSRQTQTSRELEQLSEQRADRQEDVRETPEQLLRKVRIGHLRWLPKGQHYTDAAARIYAAETGNDLAVMQFIRWQQNPEKTGRATTYVSPIWQVDETPEPIIVRVPHIEGF